MKRFYTFEPKNFRIFDKMKGFLAIALMMLMAVGNVNAQVYRAVTDASQLAVGDRVVVVAEYGTDYYAMDTNQNANNRGCTKITVASGVASWTGSAVQVLTLEAGTTAGTFAMNTGAGYIYAASSSSNQLKTQANINANASWSISIVGGTTSIVAQGSNTRNKLRYNGSSKIFSCYASGQTEVTLYKESCAEISNLTATPSTNSITYTWTSEATNFDFMMDGSIQSYTPVAGLNHTWTLTVNGFNPNAIHTFGVKNTCATNYTYNQATTTCFDYSAVNTINASIAEGTSYSFAGIDRTTAGTYTNPLTDIYGCDSTVTLHLTVVVPAYINREYVSECDSYTFHTFGGNDIICTETNIYRDTLPGAAVGGLDSIHEVYLTINHSYNIDTTMTVCQNDLPFNFGIYNFPVGTAPRVMPVPMTQTFRTAQGCDSTVTLHLTIGSTFTSTDERTICENDLPYTWNGVTFTTVGVHVEDATLAAANGCDSVVTMTLTVNPNTAFTINDNILENNLPYELNGQEYTTTGTYFQTLSNANGCDSVITLNLTVYSNVTADVTKEICDNELPYTWNDVEFAAAGTGVAVLFGQGLHGVDSTVNMTLVVNPTRFIMDAITICDNELPFHWNGVEFTAAGVDTAYLRTAHNCDSVVEMTVTVNPTYNEAEEIDVCHRDLPYTWNDTTFYAASTLADTTYTYVYHGHSALTCDSTVTLTLHVHPNTTATVDVTVLENDLPYDFHGNLYSTPGTYYPHIQTVYGCDSAVTLNFNVLYNVTVNVDSTICSSMLPMNWNGIEFTAAGTQNAVLTASNGVDSTVVMTLNVKESPIAAITITVCDNELPIDTNGVHFTAAGTQEVQLTAANGCDSTLTMTLIVNPTYNENAGELTICENELPYTWRNVTITENVADSIYTFHRTTVNGCDSVVTLHVFVNNVGVCTFNVNYEAQPAHGTVSGPTTVNHGTDAVYTFTPESDCYYVATATLDGTNVLSQVVDNTLTIDSVVAHHTLDVTFAQYEYIVTATQVEHATITATDTFACGTNVTYNVTTEEGYHIEYITVDGTQIPNVDSYDFNDIHANHSITAMIAIDTYTITATAGGHGAISPVGVSTVNWHSTPVYTITPAPCYEIASLVVNGTAVENPTSTYTFTAMEADATIDVTFQMIHYDLTWSNIGNGEGTLNGVGEGVFTTAMCGEMVQGYTAQAAEGSHIASVVWNNNPIVLGGNLTQWTINIPMIVNASNTNVQINYTLDQHTVTAISNDVSMGTVTPSSNVVNYNTSSTVTISAVTPMYHIDRIVCGDSTLTLGGNDDVTYTYTVNNVTSDTTVEVYFAINTYNITVSDDMNGVVTPNDTVVEYGADVNFTITPNACYYTDAILVDGIDTVNPNLTNVVADHDVNVTFAIYQYTMTGVANDPIMGTITGGTADCGSTFEYVVDANTGYHVDSIKLGANVIATYNNQPNHVSCYVSNVQSNTNIDVYFSINQYEVTATATNGTITPSSSTVAHGGSQTFNMTPGDCQELTSVLVNGVEMITAVVNTPGNRVELLNEDFASLTRGGDDQCNSGSNSASLVGWSGNRMYQAEGKIKAGGSNALGKVNLPSLDCSANAGEFHVAFDAKAWGGDQTTMKMIVTSGANSNTYNITNLSNRNDCNLTHYDIAVTGGTTDTRITFEGLQALKSRFFLDNVVVYTGSEAGYQLTVSPINEATTVAATFSQIEYNVVTEVTEGEGTITPSYVVPCGERNVVELTAGEGYHINYYVLNGDTTILNTNANVTELVTINGDRDDSVYVAFAINTYEVRTLAASGVGTFTPATQVVNHGGTAMVQVDADVINGYHIVDIYSDATNVENYGGNADVTASYTLNNIVSDTTIKANFALNLYPITVTNNNPEHGTVVPMTQDWHWGDDASFVITPNTPCYYISDITVDGIALTAGVDYTVTGYTYTFSHVVDAHTLDVNFTDSIFHMTATVNPGSSATVTTGDAHCGDTWNFEISAAEGQHLSMLFVDNVLNTVFDNTVSHFTTDTTITFTDVHADHSVVVFTATDEYAVNVTTTGEGITNYDGDTNVVYNGNLNFIFTPDACRELVSFTMNGVEYIDSVVANAYTWVATEDANFVVTYDTIRYIMAETHTGNGTVSFDSIVNCGDTYTYTVTADYGWHIASCVLSDGVTSNEQMVLPTTNADNAIMVDVTADANYLLTVTFEINKYNVTACTPAEGTIAVSRAMVEHGDTVSFVINATAPGYHVQTAYSNVDNDVETYGNNEDVTVTYVLSNVISDTSVCATFELNNYTINASVADAVNGEITPVGDTAVRYGDDVIYIIRPTNDCHYISTVVVDDTTELVFNDSVPVSYTFMGIDNNHTIVANFETYRYEVATSVNDINLGTITATDTLDCGETFDFVVTPIVGQHISQVTIDGIDQVIADSSTFTGSITDIHANHTIVANFGINRYNMTVIAGANGVITPGDTVLEHGQSIVYSIRPNDCYYISELIVDGESQPSMIADITGMDFTFASVSEAHTLEANFAIYTYDMNETHTGNGTVSTVTDINCGEEYVYAISADQGWHIASIELGGNTVYNTMVEPNDFNDTIYTVAAARMDTTINVVFEIDHYTVSACTAVGGTLVVNAPVEVDSNLNTTVTVTADAANGYHIVNITDNRGGSMSFGNNTDVTYTYPVNNVDRDIEVCATFALNTFNIHAEAGMNGTITPAGDTTIAYDQTITYTIEPNHTCYYISAINVDGTNVWAGYADSVNPTTYTFTASDFAADALNHTITTEYTIFEYNMTSNAYTEGTVSSATVNCGTDYTYNIQANIGWHIDYVDLDGTITNYTGQPSTDAITITDVQSHHNLDVYFARNYYAVTASATEHGTLTVAGTTSIEHGQSVSYTITPDHCYYISEINVNGVAQPISNVDGEVFTYGPIVDTTVIVANFGFYRYNMNETHVGNGTVTTAVVDCDAQYIYTMTADQGWHIDNHTMGGVTYTLNHNSDVVAYRNVAAATQDTMLEVVFARNLYNIDVTSTGNGVTTPGDTTVEYEANVAYTMTAEAGYHIASVMVDGVAENVPANAVTYNYAFNNIAADHTLDVVYEANIYTITAGADAHGTITIAGDNEVAFGGSVSFAIAADECYNISAVLVDGVADANFQGGVATATYTMDNVDANHTVQAQFAINTYNVTVTSTGNGTVTPGTATYNCGDDVNFIFTPAIGSAVANVTVNGTSIGAQNSYSILGINADYTIEVEFSDVTYTLNAVAYNNGTITPAGETTVGYHASMTYTLTPDACQTVSEILVNGVSYLDSANFNGTTLTLSEIESDMNIQAYFQVMTYNVTATQVEGGVITESGVYNCGTDVVYTITPNACYSIVDVTVDGVSVGNVGTYTFTAIGADHTITATFLMDTYTVTATAGVGGTITATETFDCGETPTYTITPDAGYYIVNVDVDGVSVGAIDTYTFGSLNANHTIEATFAKYTYTLTVNTANGVEVSPLAGDTVVEYGENVTYNFTVADCYDIVDVTVDGESVGAVTTYSFTAVDADHVLNITSAMKTYTITATATGNGVITPAGETTVNCEGSQFYSITPGVGYVISDVTVDGTSVGAVASYLFDSVVANHTIDVVFTAIADSTYTITAIAVSNGTITPAGVTTVNYGASQTYTMIPDYAYAIGDVLVDGTSVGAVSTYTFVNVTADHTIEVIFTAAECEVPTYAWTDPISTNSATLNWTDMDVNTYTIRYKAVNDTAYTLVNNITDNFYVLTGLTENTEYVWNVMSVCLASSSNWSSQQSFRTEGDTSHIDIQDFDMNVLNVYSYGSDIYVVNKGNEQISGVQVFDMNGRMIYSGNAVSNPTVINMNAANGMYVVRVITKAQVRNYKVSISQR